MWRRTAAAQALVPPVPGMLRLRVSVHAMPLIVLIVMIVLILFVTFAVHSNSSQRLG